MNAFSPNRKTSEAVIFFHRQTLNGVALELAAPPGRAILVFLDVFPSQDSL